MDNDKYIGRLLDNRYEILEVIGSGGMAVVYKARCHRLNRLVAIKILRDDFLEDEEFRGRFHAESQAVAMFSHPNIVSVYDVSTSASLETDYIVMELIDGISLKQYMEKKGVLNWKETLHFAMQIAKALEHAHSRGIVHRDIKPHNIMVLKNGSVKVADFGIAHMMSGGSTLTKEALGSVHYISPEQAKGGRVDARSDLYSLGVVMYEMMTGRPPYDGDSPVSVAIKHIDGGALLPSTINPNIPDGLEQIIMKAMANQLDDRYESATQMLSDMDEFRKDPTMLFGYNNAALESLIQFPRKPVTPPPAPAKPTTAQKKVARQKPQRRREETKNDRVSTIAIIICSILVICGIAVILWFALVNPDGRTSHEGELITVPAILEMSEQQLEDLSDSPNYDIIWEYEYSETVAKDQLIRTEPEAGKKIAKGAKIKVYVSLGPAPTMLNVLEMAKDEAQSYLELLNKQNNLQLEVVCFNEHSVDIPVGKVIRTEPKAGEPLKAKDTITLYISQGAEEGTMPRLEEFNVEVAKELLNKQNMNLQIRVEEEFNSTLGVGKVVRTKPEKGTELKLNDEVILYVSKGPELKTLPWLVGVHIDTAKNSLSTAGFLKAPEIRYVDSDKPAGTVVSQSPEAYKQADVNTIVVLEISLGPEVVKTLTISIPEASEEEERKVEIYRDGNVVLFQTVAPDCTSVELPNQKGRGKVTYALHINDLLVREWEETF